MTKAFLRLVIAEKGKIIGSRQKIQVEISIREIGEEGFLKYHVNGDKILLSNLCIFWISKKEIGKFPDLNKHKIK